jgi:hypothetical protein
LAAITEEFAWNVDAVGVDITVVGLVFTFVNVPTGGVLVQLTEARLTKARECTRLLKRRTTNLVSISPALVVASVEVLLRRNSIFDLDTVVFTI